MKCFVLCGGLGTRLQNDTTFPKPLNHILGVSMFEYVLNSIPYDEITVVMNKDLREYNFDTTIHHMTSKYMKAVYLNRQTRGALETAYLGVLDANVPDDEPICFFDNDTLYNAIRPFPETTFIGYSTLKDPTKYHPYSFITTTRGSDVVDIQEKVQISDKYCCGIYGFKSAGYFLERAREVLMSDKTTELYMSVLYSHILSLKEQVTGVELPQGTCLGTHEDVAENITRVPYRKLRVCFDIDNTIIKYRTPEQTYADCEPNDKMVYFLRRLKQLGHCIILYTARGMASAERNIGKSVKNVAYDTFKSLEKLHIPYDEIYFGKPDADFYIDDKAFNPYLNTFQSVGFDHLNQEYLLSKFETNTTNKYNTIYKTKDVVVKTGPTSSMAGEAFFYSTVKETALEGYFPKFIKSQLGPEVTKLYLSYVHGFTLFELFRDGLFTLNHLDQVLDALDTIHAYPIQIDIPVSEVYHNYMTKLKKRIENKADYPFQNTKEIVDKMDPYVQSYLYKTRLTGVVHGDPWFSNTLLSNNKVIFLDMKGDVNGKLTTNGDPLTDYCKIFQSLLGFDFIVQNIPYGNLTHLQTYYLNKLVQRGYDLNDVYAVTACLIAKTISFFDPEFEFKNKIWDLVVQLMDKLPDKASSLNLDTLSTERS